MKLVRYICTHCGKKFEAEEKEILECPGCFWSTSVKREDDAGEPSVRFSPAAVRKKPFIFPWVAVLTIAAVILTGSLFLPFFSSFLKKENSSRPLNIRAVEQTTDLRNKPEKKISLPKIGFPKKKEEPKIEAPPVQAPLISPEDANILARRVEVSAEREPSPEERKILQFRASFSSGAVEKLPSQAWTLEDYKKMLAAQEKFFQVPLPGSYKRKLYDLFEKKYAAAANAFKEGNLVEARNLWAESLAYPVYSNNIQKHRGVVLTMHRGIINDTLSKIGAINNALSENKNRAKEEEITTLYTKLLSEVDRGAWPEAYASAVSLDQKLDVFQKGAAADSPIETYPQAVSQVDDSVRSTLFDLLNVPPPTQGDLEPIQRDLLLKRKVIESFLPANLEPVQLRYREALDLIDQKNWAGAEEKLRGIVFPIALQSDAQDKLKVLRKLQLRTTSSVQPPVQG